MVVRAGIRRSRRSPGGFRSWSAVGVAADVGQCAQPLGAPPSSAVRKLEPQPQAATAFGLLTVKPGAHQGVDVVDLRALEQVDALAVDVDLDPVRRRGCGPRASGRPRASSRSGSRSSRRNRRRRADRCPDWSLPWSARGACTTAASVRETTVVGSGCGSIVVGCWSIIGRYPPGDAWIQCVWCAPESPAHAHRTHGQRVSTSVAPKLSSWRLRAIVHPLHDRRDPLADADAHRREAVAAAGPAQLVDQHRDQAAAAHPERMAERDRAAVDVDLGRVEPELVDADERLGRERLVELDEVEVLDGDARPLERLARRRAPGRRPSPPDRRRRRPSRRPAPSAAGRARGHAPPRPAGPPTRRR